MSEPTFPCEVCGAFHSASEIAERKYEDGEYACGWNDSIREVERLNRRKT